MASAIPRPFLWSTDLAGLWNFHALMRVAICLGFGLLLVPLHDTSSFDPEAEYGIAQKLFQHGNIEQSQLVAERGYGRSIYSNPEVALRFRLLETEAMRWGGTFGEALRRLSAITVPPENREGIVQKLALEGLLQNHLQHSYQADRALDEADHICATSPLATCGEVARARGLVALDRGEFAQAQTYFLKSLDFAEVHHDKWQEALALSNVGVALLQQERNDEAADWLRTAYRAATSLNAEDQAQRTLGNLGWAYFGLGDTERALDNFLGAEKGAAALGDRPARLIWLTTSGDVYRSTHDFAHAERSLSQALVLAKQLDSPQQTLNVLEDLTDASIDAGNLDAANSYLAQVSPLVRQSGNRLDAMDVALEQGRIAALRNDPQAESLLRNVEKDSASQVTMKLSAEHEMARLFEAQGRIPAAKAMYATTLATFESARSDIKNEDAKLPFLTNATRIYDDYIHFLVKQGRTDEALAAADQSRARTLAQGLGLDANKPSSAPAALHAGAIARKTEATLLFYWLGQQQSYLWAITPTEDRTVQPAAAVRNRSGH